MKAIRLLSAAIGFGLAVVLLYPTVSERVEHKETARHDKPGEADRWYYEQRFYPDGLIPGQWEEQARLRIDEMNALRKTAAAGWKFISIGPENISGRIRSMAMDPANPNILYAGSAGGGIWKTTNGGRLWTALSEYLPNLRIGSIAVSPFNSNLILAGNGEGFVYWQGGMAYGRGIYRSEDGGATIRSVPSTDNPDFEFVFDIAFDPFDPDIVLASTGKGTFRSTDAGWTWKKTPNSPSGARGMMAVFSRTVPGKVYSAVESRGVYCSTNHGETWEMITPEALRFTVFGRIVLAAAPTNGDILYAAFTAEDQSCVGVFRTDNCGETWTQLAIPMNEITGQTYMGEQGSYNSCLTVHPDNPDVLLAGGIDLYKSVNGGRNWRQISNWYANRGYPYVHADQHALIINPANPSECFIANDGGVFRTGNLGASYETRNGGLVTTQFHSIAPHPSGDFAIGGTIDNGSLKLAESLNWKDVSGGDGGYTAIDYRNPSIVYTELYYLHFLKSVQHGETGTFRVKMSGIPRSLEFGTTDRCAFIAPFEMDPNDPSVLYAGTYRLYRTGDGAESWYAVSPDLSGGGVITAIGLTQSEPRTIYVGSSRGNVYLSTNAGGTWKDISAGLPERYVTDFAVNPRFAGHVAISYSGFNAGHVYQSTNYGAAWKDASGAGNGGLPNVPVSSIALHPDNPALLFAGSDVGLFVSHNGGENWSVHNDGMGNVAVADLRFRLDKTLFVATHGRGVYRSNVPLGADGSAHPPVATALLTAFPNPLSLSNPYLYLNYTLADPRPVRVEVYDRSGKLALARDFGPREAGSYRERLDVRSAGAGLLFIRMRFGSEMTEPVKAVVLP